MMQLYCDFSDGPICRVCKAPLQKGVPLDVTRACPYRRLAQIKESIECPYLLDYAGKSVRLFGFGCPSERVNGIMTGVFECQLHGKCVPFIGGDRLSSPEITRCQVCNDNPSRKT